MRRSFLPRCLLRKEVPCYCEPKAFSGRLVAYVHSFATTGAMQSGSASMYCYRTRMGLVRIASTESGWEATFNGVPIAGQISLSPYQDKSAITAIMGRVLHAGDRIRVNGLNIGWTATEGEQGIQAETGASPDWLEEADANAPLTVTDCRVVGPLNWS